MSQLYYYPQQKLSMSNKPEFEYRCVALIAEIETAFDGVSRADGTTLHEANAKDDRLSEAEQRAARRFDTETIWQAVPEEDIAACHSALSFLCPKGFRYYLPAFMSYGLNHLEADPNGILQSCLFHLMQNYPMSLRKSEPSEIAARYDFNDAQCRAIANFLRFVVGDDVMMTKYSAPEWKVAEKWERYANERNSAGKIE